MALRDRLLKKSTVEETAALEFSKIYEKKDAIITNVPALNIALSGSLYGGMTPGLLQIAGKSKRFKSKFALLLGKFFIEKFTEGAVLFYDSEFGTPESYFNEIPIENIIHTPIYSIEKLKHDITVQMESLEKNDKLLIILDSLGNLASEKEIKDAVEGKEVADMTRAKQIRSLFRIIGPRLAIKDIYMIVINHTYDPMEQYKPEVVGGGGGTIYNSNGIWVITAEKEKDGKDVVGYEFKIKIEKSRFVRQDSVIPITVLFDSGIDKWSGLLELAIEGGYVKRPTSQKYCLANEEEVFSLKELVGNDQFYTRLLEKTDFSTWVENNFQYKN